MRSVGQTLTSKIKIILELTFDTINGDGVSKKRKTFATFVLCRHSSTHLQLKTDNSGKQYIYHNSHCFNCGHFSNPVNFKFCALLTLPKCVPRFIASHMQTICL